MKKLLESWERKRVHDKRLKEIEAKKKTREEKEKIKEEAYLLWEADGKPEGVMALRASYLSTSNRWSNFWSKMG
jgi:hypothetical protein